MPEIPVGESVIEDFEVKLPLMRISRGIFNEIFRNY